MANTARVTQSYLIAGTLQNGNARVTQSFLIFGIGLGITCGNPPSGMVGAPYSHTFPSGGGTLPLTFSIITGALPPGLTLDPATGIVSGVPTENGNFAFTIQVVDAMNGAAAVACGIIISVDLLINFIGAKVFKGAR